VNKADLVARVAAQTGLSRRNADEAVNATLASITAAVSKGERVSLPGFGTFEARRRSARTARNPQTGAVVKVGATTVPAFRAGQGFKQAVARRGGTRAR
jgi:DNA-binding protein HU-beta